MPERRKELAYSTDTPGAADAGEAWARWGAYYEEAGNYPAARWAYGQAYAYWPRPELAMRLGRTAERVGDISGAIAAYASVLGASPSSGVTLKKGS
ncbi:MAG: tetratricopeptide repeat protein [Chthonomonadales bacterium]